MSKEFTISIDYEGNAISLVTRFDSKWNTNIVINGKKSADILHKKPISTPEKSRDIQFIDRIKSAIDVKPKVAMKLINDMIDDVAEKYFQDIEALQKEVDGEKEEALKDQKEQRDNQIQMYYDILKNKSGTYSVEEIEAAKIGLKYIMMPTFWSLNDSGAVILNKLNIARYIKIAFNLALFGGRIWRYDWNDAYYSYDPEDEIINKAVSDIMDEVGQPNFQYNGNIISDKAQIIEKASLEDVYTKSPFNQCSGLINAKNGVLKLDFETRKVTLIGKKPEYMFSYCVDTLYDPNADPGPIDKFIEEVVGPGQKEIIYQIAALAIRDADVSLDSSKVAYYFVGKPNTGKNAIMRLLSSFIGQTNVSTIPLHDIAEDKFVKALLEGKLINLDDEAPVSFPMDESREIKSITGGKRHTINPKGIRQYQGIITALLVFAGNQFPKCHIPESDEAFWKRWDVLHFNHVFDVNEKFGKLIFTPENLSGFFNKVIEKLFEINDFGIKRLSSPEKVYMEWQYSSNSVFKFIKDAMVETQVPYTHFKSELHKEYLNWCEVNHIPKEDIKMQAEDFGREIIRKCKADSVRSGNIPAYRMFKTLKPQTVEVSEESLATEQVKPKGSLAPW